jgi:recombination protein RecT
MAKQTSGATGATRTVTLWDDRELAKPLSTKERVSDLVEWLTPNFAKTLDGDEKLQRSFKMALLNSFSRTPSLLNCTAMSVKKALLNCAAMRLWPDTPQQHAHMIPYKTDCTLIVGYRGLLELMWRSGKLRDIYCESVHEADIFDVKLGTEKRLHHVPDFGENVDRSDDSKIRCVYCVSVNEFGEKGFTIMTRSEIEKVRGASRGSKSDFSPWQNWWEQMALKTVLRRRAKWLPMSEEFRKAEEVENEFSDLKKADYTVRESHALPADLLKQNGKAAEELAANGKTEKVTTKDAPAAHTAAEIFDGAWVGDDVKDGNH